MRQVQLQGDGRERMYRSLSSRTASRAAGNLSISIIQKSLTAEIFAKMLLEANGEYAAKSDCLNIVDYLHCQAMLRDDRPYNDGEGGLQSWPCYIFGRDFMIQPVQLISVCVVGSKDEVSV